MNGQLHAAAGKTRVIRVDKTLHVFIDANDKAESLVKKCLNSGESVTEDGEATWVSEMTVFDPTKPGSAAYQWKGDKVRVERFLVRKTKAGETRESIGFAWREW